MNKRSQNIITIIVGVLIIVVVVFRLISNKKNMEKELDNLISYERIVPVEVYKVSLDSFSNVTNEIGKFVPQTVVPIISEAQGKVTALYVKTGDFVKKGQVLAEIDKEVISSQLTTAKTNMDNAERDMNRLKILSEGDAVTKQQYEASVLNFQNAKATYTALKKSTDDTKVRASISGYISDKTVENGSLVSPGMPLMTISDMTRMKFETRVSEEIVNTLKFGQRVEIYTEYSKNLSGSIKEIDIKSDESGKYKVTVEINGGTSDLKGGMSARMKVKSDKTKKSLVIPRKAVVGSIESGDVFIVLGDSVKIRKVSAESINNEKVVIKQGLSDGETIVLTGQINLTEGTKIKVINK